MQTHAPVHANACARFLNFVNSKKNSARRASARLAFFLNLRNFGNCVCACQFFLYDVSMIVYDVNHQEMMFKVANKASKAVKTLKKIHFSTFFKKSVENNFGPIQNM